MTGLWSGTRCSLSCFPHTGVVVYRRDLPFTKTAHLSNPWNEHKPVKIGRDGQVSHDFIPPQLFLILPETVSVKQVMRFSGDPTGHRRPALCPLSIGRERGRTPGGSTRSSQAPDSVGATASGPTTAAGTGKVSQSPSSSSRFLFFFFCCDHGATCCRTMETAAAFSQRLAIPWLALLVLWWLLLIFQSGVFHRSNTSCCVWGHSNKKKTTKQ